MKYILLLYYIAIYTSCDKQAIFYLLNVKKKGFIEQKNFPFTIQYPFDSYHEYFVTYNWHISRCGVFTVARIRVWLVKWISFKPFFCRIVHANTRKKISMHLYLLYRETQKKILVYILVYNRLGGSTVSSEIENKKDSWWCGSHTYRSMGERTCSAQHVQSFNRQAARESYKRDTHEKSSWQIGSYRDRFLANMLLHLGNI